MTTPVPASTPRLGVIAVVLRDGQVVMVQRRNPPEAGSWGFPGGKVEWGETIYSAAARELHEETGIQAAPARILTSFDVIGKDATGAVAWHYHIAAVLCRYRSGEPVAADDAMAAEWVAAADLLEPPHSECATQVQARRTSARVAQVLRLALDRL
ncbi:MAG TPA: NUDIX hydrolase [Paenirhodobacter sp.]